MSDLNGDTLMAQVLTNVIIGNTSSGKGDHFWDNGEGNLLKALILLIDQDRTRSPDMKHLSAVYQLLTQNSERQLTAMFDKLPLDHPARAPFNLFAQSSDTVRSGIILGLGTRLQVLQNQAVQRITSRSDIDLTAPGRNKCIYYIVLSDQDAMPSATYTFDADGKMVIKNGIYREKLGDGNEYLFYYVNNVRQVNTGLVQLDDGSYIYVRSGANLAVGSYYVSKTNDLLPKGTYTFGEDGKMIIS